MTTIGESRALQIEQGDLWEGMKVNGTWFHVLRSFSHDKEIAKIGTMALAVYIVIKGHTDFHTGSAFPSIPTIAEQIGVTDDTIRLALKQLVKHGWLTVGKKGRSNLYSVVEKVHINDKDGQRWATAERKYVGKEFQGFVEELQRLVKTGNLPTDRAITVNLTVNIQNNTFNGENNTATLNVQNVNSSQDDEERIKALRKI